MRYKWIGLFIFAFLCAAAFRRRRRREASQRFNKGTANSTKNDLP